MARRTGATALHRTLPVLGLLGAAVLVPFAAAQAADGVIEINQAAVEAGGITPGDGAGFPARITRSGSYVLTSNLVTPNEGLSAIRVVTDDPNNPANDVRIDLNGFALIGPRTCSGSGSAISCTGELTNVGGVRAEGVARTSVRNGTVQGFRFGIWLGEGCAVEEVIAFHNTSAGFLTGPNCIVVHNIAVENGAAGFNAARLSVLRENAAGGNRGVGVLVLGEGAATIERNVSGRNGLAGIQCTEDCSISRNVSTRNEGRGINAGDGVIVSGNVACENDSHELVLGPLSGYTDNVLVDTRPGADPPVSGGVFMDPNLCNTSTNPVDCQ